MTTAKEVERMASGRCAGNQNEKAPPEWGL
jgi:hypothetical protein